jgi:hypothetical protein
VRNDAVDREARLAHHLTPVHRRMGVLSEVEEALTFACPECYTSADFVPTLAKGCLLHSLGRWAEAMDLFLDEMDGRLVCGLYDV